jgi:flagellar biosynthesis protein FlhG
MSASVRQQNQWNKKTKTISVTSGKGGVGKSTFISNMALYYARNGKKVLILDGDVGMANIDVMFGVRPQLTIADVLNGSNTLEEILTPVAPNVLLIPGGSGIYGLQSITAFEKKMLLDQVSALKEPVDIMLIDTASGIDDNVLYLNSAAQETVVLVTPEPSSMADAYALIKVMNLRFAERRFSVVVNMAQDEAEALSIYERLSDVASRFLCVGLDYKGFIPSDLNLRNATKSQQLIMDIAPRSPSSLAIHQIAEKLSYSTSINGSKGGMQFFWEQLVGVA